MGYRKEIEFYLNATEIYQRVLSRVDIVWSIVFKMSASSHEETFIKINVEAEMPVRRHLCENTDDGDLD